jgi:DNA-binding beta-propeller fold protein YncE
VINQFSKDIAVVDPSSSRPVGHISLPGDPLFAALSPDERTVYVVTNTDHVLAVARPGHQLRASGAVTQAGFGLSVHPSGRWVYASMFTAGSVLELDARTLTTTRRFTTGGSTQECLVSQDGLTLYAANESGWLDAVHLPSGRQIARLTFDAGALSLALSPDDAMLYVGLTAAGRVACVDRDRLVVVGMIETGGLPRRIAFDASGHTAFVANESGWVDLIV